MDVHFHHLCIQTNDYQRSYAFYCELLGATLVKETKNFHSRDFNTWLKLGEMFIELQTPKRGHDFTAFTKQAAGIAHFCLLVPDLSAAVASIQARGYDHFQRKNGAIMYQVEGSGLAKLIAPEGTIIELRDCPTL